MDSRGRLTVLWMDDDETSQASRACDDAGAKAATSVRCSIARARELLLSEQQPDGHWVAELEGDSILQSEYLLLLAFLGELDAPIVPKLARRLIETQLPQGGWGQYPGAAIDISASVKAYFALKLAGHEPTSGPMERARRAILAHGGADAVNSFTRFYLALLGQISYEQCPVVPPELTLLPQWFPVNLYAMSAWTRTIVVPLSIMSASRPVRAIEPERGIRELFLRKPEDWPQLRSPGLEGEPGLFSWHNLFHGLDRVLHFLERRRWMPLRKRALATAERWMVDRFAGSDGLGAIFPPMVWSVIALRCLGYSDDSPEMRFCRERLTGLIIEDETSARLQPCKSPVWDTAIALRAVSEAGTSPDHPAVQEASRWLLDRQILRDGDWSKTVKAEPGGWCFEYENDFYPDVDDTAMVSLALARQFAPPADAPAALPPPLSLVGNQRVISLSFAERLRAAASEPSSRSPESASPAENSPPRSASPLERTAAALDRAARWMLAMQNRDGGWGAFDRNNDRQFLCHVPFADHNAMIDPSTPDLTARVLEALGELGYRVGHPAIDRAIAYLRKTQEADGSWFGRWGVNYIYGVWQTITGLAAVGVGPNDPAVAAGVNWLLAWQQPSGGWGESADSYLQPSLRGQGPATPSQTAWAVLGLIAGGRSDHPAVARGVRWLQSHQQPDGEWLEPEFTGTGFPRVFYLRYHMYRHYFPLLALARYGATAAAIPGSVGGPADDVSEPGADEIDGEPLTAA